MNKIIFFLIIYLFFNIICQICEENKNNCKKCDPFKKLCHECTLNIFTPDGNGGCKGIKICDIGDNYCDECNQENNICKICENGYYPDENGGCSYTDNCEISFKGECITCKSNYFLIGANTNLKLCKSKFTPELKNCKSINETNGVCISCEEGFYLNKGDKRCIDIENCYKSTYGICTNCFSGHYLDKKENKCKKQSDNFIHCSETLNGKNCDKCDKDYFFDNEGKCVSTNFCFKSKNFECKECIEGYYLMEDKSCSIEKNCKNAYRDTGICYWCSNNYYLNLQNKCISYSESENNLKFCKIFTDKCIKCDENYTFGADEKCVKSKNCEESEEGICTLCSKGYYLGLDNKCTDKEHCIYSSYDYFCNECEDNYVWDNYHKSCKPVEDNIKFKNCKLTFDGYKCSSCKKGYYFNNTDSLCYENTIKNKYYKCKRVYAGICNECEEGYFFGYGDYLCSKVEFCLKSQDENTCIQCRPNYCLDGNNATCINNMISEKINYFRCLKTDKMGLCKECETNLTLKDGLCISDNDCIEKNENVCIKCKNKSEFTYSCLNDIFGCVVTNVKNCAICNNIKNLNECTKCDEGFELDEDGNCIINQL